MTNYSIGDIYTVLVEFQEADGRAKPRPVVIVDIEEGDPVVLVVAQLTGQGPKEPPGYFDQYKIPIKDWQQVPLKKESWVKSHPNNILRIDPSALRVYRGSLSPNDLREVLKAIF